MSNPPPIADTDAAPSLGEEWRAFVAWLRSEPVSALLLAAIIAVFVYFFGFYKVFVNGSQSLWDWTRAAWNSENDLEHGGFIFPAALYFVWYHRAELRAARKEPAWSGLAFVIGAAALFIIAARTLQPRVALLAIPLLGYGAVRFLWGRETARVVIFPCAFLLFMIPVGFLVSRTVGLQTLAASVAANLAGLLGIHVIADGASLHAVNHSFDFEVAGGCSGIRSLTAMTMLAAAYVHFTQREMWKKLAIFAGSLVFALIGNLVRIFTVVIFAAWISPTVAAGIYHDYSGFIFFPIAVSAMVSFGNLLSRDWSDVREAVLARDEKPAKPAAAQVPETVATTPAAATSEAPESKPASPISYDY